MTQEDIIRMAREADSGFQIDAVNSESLVGIEAIERFAQLVAAAEREACAKVCDEHNGWTSRMIAQEIRNRCQK